MTEIQRERELKFEVRPGFEIPDVTDLVVGGVVEHSVISLSSTYYDSPGLDLLTHAVTLRRRTGDDDNGWQLKIPAEGARNELRRPLTDDAVVPPELSGLLAGIVRAADLTPVATLDTERRLTRVRLDGELVVEIADDQVVASTGGRQCEQWREVEIELGAGGDEQALAAFADRLTESGATGSPHPSKLGRALGRGRQRAVSSAAGELVGDHLRTAFRRIVAGDIAVRTGAGTEVHRTRVSVRRVRAVLRVFADVIGTSGNTGRTDNSARALDAELAWYQHLLAAVDEPATLRTRLAAAVAELPATLVHGPVAADVDRVLGAEQDAAFAALAAALATNRYRRMLATLATLATGDPVTDATTLSDLRRLADDAGHTAATRLRRAVHAVAPDPEQLHRARKAVVRARYAAEVVAPARKHPKRAVHTLRHVQDALGAHQDAVVASETLARLAAGAGNGFTYGLLYQRALDTAERLRHDASALRLPT